jgi:type I restriction enzyme S subunit
MKSDIKDRIEKLKRGQVPEGYKKIQGQIMPDSWNIYKLEELIASSDYGTSEQTNDTKGYPVLRMGNLVDGKISSENLVYVDLDRESFNNLKLEKGDLLFNRTNSYDLVGKVSLFDLDGDYTFASYLIRLKVINSKVLPKYLNYYMNLNSSQKQIKTFSTKGVQQVNVNITTLKKFFKVKLPSNIFEQQKIIDILSTWDKAIELKEKLIEQKKEQKKGLMQRLLTGKVRLPGFKGEWKEVRLGEVLKERKETGHVHLELLAITAQRGIVRRDEVDIKDNSSEDKSKYKRIMPLDIGYNTMRMWQGVSGVSKYEGIVSPAYTVLKPTDKVDSYFMGYLFKLPKVIDKFRRYSQGLVDDTLNLKYENFKVIKVKIPQDVNEQKAIAQILICVDKEIEFLEKELEALKQQKKGLMQLLLTGKVRVKC